jgi:hypothetical protein
VRQRGEPFEVVLDDALRKTLRGRGSVPAAPFRRRTFDTGLPQVDFTNALALADELGDAALIAEMKRRASS